MQEIQTRIEDGVGIITISRPEALNAINHAVMDGLLSAASMFDADDTVGCILITGAGDKAFIATHFTNR